MCAEDYGIAWSRLRRSDPIVFASFHFTVFSRRYDKHCTRKSLMKDKVGPPPFYTNVIFETSARLPLKGLLSDSLQRVQHPCSGCTTHSTDVMNALSHQLILRELSYLRSRQGQNPHNRTVFRPLEQ